MLRARKTVMGHIEKNKDRGRMMVSWLRRRDKQSKAGQKEECNSRTKGEEKSMKGSVS